jgi:single-stranded DNA-specific DHH superfamily exonuclease
MQIDVFNGDADGICALLQLRLARPSLTQLITGVKRDMELLTHVNAQAGDYVTVLDISLAKNRLALNNLLQQGVSVLYIDHHQAGDIPEHPQLETLIRTEPTVCTSLLVDHYLGAQYRAWAVVAAFGDNLNHQAEQAARFLSINSQQLHNLKTLGIAMNYNSYGESVADLQFAPDVLYRHCLPYSSPLDFISDKRAIFEQLKEAYSQDMTQALAITAEYQSANVAVYMLPDTVWAKRVSGVLSNELANRQPNRAHAVVSHTNLGNYQISVRAPLNNPVGADVLCASFATGGGRQNAAGINHLSAKQLPFFINAFAHYYDAKKH